MQKFVLAYLSGVPFFDQILVLGFDRPPDSLREALTGGMTVGRCVGWEVSPPEISAIQHEKCG